MIDQPSIVLITGVMASGKSTVAELLAQQLPLAAHVRGDKFRRMIVSGQAEMTNPLSDGARTQLRLRHRMAARTADDFARAGITAVVQDLYLGNDLPRMAAMIGHRPLYVVVLAPNVEAIESRETARTKTGYGADWTATDFDRHLRDETPRIGLWLDTSTQTAEATVAEILARSTEARTD